MDRGAWRATIYIVGKSQTRLRQLSMHAHHLSKTTLAFFFNLFKETLWDPRKQMEIWLLYNTFSEGCD